MFRLVRQLETRRTLPSMVDGARVISSHEEISDMIAEQLSPGPAIPWIVNAIEVDSAVELENAIKRSPVSTGPGLDDIGYPLIRLWARSDIESMRDLVSYGLKFDLPDGHVAEVVLIPKADKLRYDIVKSWRIIHLLPTMAKIADRIILARLAACLELEATQFGSRTGRGCHDAMAVVYEFLEYNKGMSTAMLSMDVQGGFDNIDVNLLSDFLVARGCPGDLCCWIRWWAMRRVVRFHFNGRVSRRYHVNKGIPQGSPLSPFLFGAYVADILRPRLRHSPAVRCVVSSYVDDGVILVAADGKDLVRDTLAELFDDCVRVARGRGMGFSTSKTNWIGFGGGDWGTLRIGGRDVGSVEVLRVLGYWFNVYANFSAHVDYWLARGLEVRRRRSVVGRRFGGTGGIGTWETFRLFQSAYLPVVYYGLEFLTGFSPCVKRIQVHVNDCLRSIFRTPARLANNILLAECGTPPTRIQGRYLQRRCFAKMINKQYCDDHPWFGCIRDGWGDPGTVAYPQFSAKELTRTPTVTVGPDKDIVCAADKDMLETWAGDPGIIVYPDGSKNPSGGRASVAWVTFEVGIAGVPYGISVLPSWSIVECELFAMLGGLRSILSTYAGTVHVYSDCVPALRMIDAMTPLSDSAGLWDMFTPLLNRFESVSISWVPGQCGIHGNEPVDTAARNAITPLETWRWDGLCFGIGQLEVARTARSDEWSKWHREEGHSYYTRKSRKPSHLKKLTRIDFYVIMRLRTGTGVSGHDPCCDDLPRYHLLDCLRFAAGRPCRGSHCDDKVIGDGVDWARQHFHLGMGIPKGLVEIDGCLVVAGNPFTGCAIVNKDGSMVQVGFLRRPCGRCGSLVANHKCRRPTDTIPDKYYFLGPNDTHCRMCDSRATLVNQPLRLNPMCHDAW